MGKTFLEYYELTHLLTDPENIEKDQNNCSYSVMTLLLCCMVYIACFTHVSLGARLLQMVL